MKKFLLIPLFILFSAMLAFAQDFEGVIEFKKQEGTASETTVWYVKGDLVRVDEFEPGSRVLKSAHILNMKDSTVRYLDHKAKTSQLVSTMTSAIPIGTTVEATKNTKEFQTYKTTESIIKTSGDSTFSYWMNTGKFGFFKTAVYLLGPVNTYLNYYWALEPKENTMPMLVTKKNSKGEETGRFEVIRIEKHAIDAALFNVPADYKDMSGQTLPPNKKE